MGSLLAVQYPRYVRRCVPTRSRVISDPSANTRLPPGPRIPRPRLSALPAGSHIRARTFRLRYTYGRTVPRDRRCTGLSLNPHSADVERSRGLRLPSRPVHSRELVIPVDPLSRLIAGFPLRTINEPY